MSTKDDKLKEPMTYQQYVGTGIGSQNYNTGVNYYQNAYSTAVDNIDKQTQAAYKYAQGVKDSTIDTSAAQRDETHRQTDISKERSIVDARSDYQKAVGAYGTNAETLASNGLGGSGYGEWLQGNAYATMRGNVQNAQAKALAQKNAADYTHNQNVLAAEGEYTKNIYGIDSQAAKDLADAQAARDKGLYELGVGLTTDRANAYNDLMTGAQTGVSLESIMNDARWGDLTSEQQTAITNAVTEYANNKATEENEANFSNWLKGISAGSYTLADVQAMAGYNNLSDPQKEQLLAASDKITADTKNAETVTTIENAINDGATLDEIKGMEGYDDLDDTTKAGIAGAIENRDERIEATVDYITEEVNSMVDMDGNATITSLSALNSFLNSYTDAEGNLLSKDMREKVVTKWQNDNADYSIDSINSARFESGKLTIDGVEITGAMLAEEINNGFYGERAKSIVTAFIKRIESGIDENDVVSVANALSQISPLHTHGANKTYSDVYKNVRFSSDYKEGDKVDSRDTIIGAEITDNDTISALEKVSSSHNDTKLLVRVGSSAYYRKNGKWYEVKILTEQEQARKDAEEAGKSYAASGKNVIDAMEEEKAKEKVKETGILGKTSSSSTANVQTDEKGNNVIVINKKK